MHKIPGIPQSNNCYGIFQDNNFLIINAVDPGYALFVFSKLIDMIERQGVILNR